MVLVTVSNDSVIEEKPINVLTELKNSTSDEKKASNSRRQLSMAALPVTYGEVVAAARVEAAAFGSVVVLR